MLAVKIVICVVVTVALSAWAFWIDQVADR